MNWQVYIILCSDNSLYTGITTDLERRFRRHANGEGAKYFRGRRPVMVVYYECGHTRSSAARREAEIKSIPREGKLLLCFQGVTSGLPSSPGKHALTDVEQQ